MVSEVIHHFREHLGENTVIPMPTGHRSGWQNDGRKTVYKPPGESIR